MGAGSGRFLEKSNAKFPSLAVMYGTRRARFVYFFLAGIGLTALFFFLLGGSFRQLVDGTTMKHHKDLPVVCVCVLYEFVCVSLCFSVCERGCIVCWSSLLVWACRKCVLH